MIAKDKNSGGDSGKQPIIQKVYCQIKSKGTIVEAWYRLQVPLTINIASVILPESTTQQGLEKYSEEY